MLLVTEQSEVDQRVREIEDPDVVFDLRALNGKDRSQYDDFWNECQKFLQADISVAVDERQHGQICHLSRAISIRDFVEQVKQRCPEGTLIPSCEWVRLQFWLKTRSSIRSRCFKLKFMVQQRQWRHQHIDSHYAAACFRPTMIVIIHTHLPTMIVIKHTHLLQLFYFIGI